LERCSSATQATDWWCFTAARYIFALRQLSIPLTVWRHTDAQKELGVLIWKIRSNKRNASAAPYEQQHFHVSFQQRRSCPIAASNTPARNYFLFI
jgi:hypothetical protein